MAVRPDSGSRVQGPARHGTLGAPTRDDAHVSTDPTTSAETQRVEQIAQEVVDLVATARHLGEHDLVERLGVVEARLVRGSSPARGRVRDLGRDGLLAAVREVITAALDDPATTAVAGWLRGVLAGVGEPVSGVVVDLGADDPGT